LTDVFVSPSLLTSRKTSVARLPGTVPDTFTVTVWPLAWCRPRAAGALGDVEEASRPAVKVWTRLRSSSPSRAASKAS
jgi:hypothetical protein